MPPDGEAEEEVVAEAAAAHLAIEVAPRRREDADVDALPSAGADALHLAALDRAEELGLERRLELADLVEEERAAVGLLEDAAVLRQRSGEGAALVAEERRLEKRRRDRGAVEDDERAPARGLASCSDSASTSLPVPVSPSMTAETSLCAKRAHSG